MFRRDFAKGALYEGVRLLRQAVPSEAVGEARTGLWTAAVRARSSDGTRAFEPAFEHLVRSLGGDVSWNWADGQAGRFPPDVVWVHIVNLWDYVG